MESIANDLRKYGHSVERCDFPQAPLPGLWKFNGHELTEQQLMQVWGDNQTYAAMNANSFAMFNPLQR